MSVLQKGWLNLDVASPVTERAMQKTGMIADKNGYYHKYMSMFIWQAFFSALQNLALCYTIAYHSHLKPQRGQMES